MIDTYTKAILTVIAVALVALVCQRAIEPASALNGGCGDLNVNPCYVEFASTPDVNINNTVSVDVMNTPLDVLTQ